MKTNPIPKTNLFASPTLEQIAAQIDDMTPEQRRIAYLVYVMTVNACHDIVGTELIKEELGLTA